MTIRELSVKLGLNVDAQSFAKGALAADAVEAGLMAIAHAAIEGAKKFAEMVYGVAEAGEQVKILAAQTGLTTDQVQNLTSAAGFAGVGVDVMASGLGILSRNMLHAKDGSAETAKIFQHLGVKVTDAHGKLRSANDVIMEISDKFKEMPDGAEKTALAMQAFGRSGKMIIPVLNEGSAGIAELASQSRNLTATEIEEGEKIVRGVKGIKAQLKSLVTAAVGPLLPAIDALVQRTRAWVKENSALIRSKLTQWVGAAIWILGKLGTVFQTVFEIVETLGKGLMWLVESPMAALAVAFGLMEVEAVASAVAAASAWALAALPFLLIGAVIAQVLIAANSLRRFFEDKDSVVGDWIKAMDQYMKPREGDGWFLTQLKAIYALLKEMTTSKPWEAFKESMRVIGRGAKTIAELGVGESAKLLAFQASKVVDAVASHSGVARALGVKGGLGEEGLSKSDLYARTPREGTAQFGPQQHPTTNEAGDYGPSLPAGGAGASGTTMVGPRFNAQIYLDASGVKNPNEIPAVLEPWLNDWWDSKMEEAGAHAGPTD